MTARHRDRDGEYGGEPGFLASALSAIIYV